jgi:hypothetical protein
VALVITDVPEELSTSFIRSTGIDKLVTASSSIPVDLMKEVLSSSWYVGC